MEIALAAVNAKYPHTNPAIRSLKKAAGKTGAVIGLREYTINMQLAAILADLYRPEIRVYGFSAYIWNIEIILKAASAVKALNPEALVLLGGPEVSYETRELIGQNPFVDYVIAGEGEAAFAAFVRFARGEINAREVPALFYRKGAQILYNPPAAPVDLDTLPFYYDDIADLKKRVIYYESSRGCPYRCSFCLSSAAEGVRYRSVELVKRDIDAFLEAGAMKVKFVDRTFNADKRRAREIISHIIGKSGETAFHFEIAAGLLDEETLALLETCPKDRIQVEAGIQSIYPPALEAVNRKDDGQKSGEALRKLIAAGNVHTHVDLIAGLPYEGYADFARSFDYAFFLKADKLQLGFLKLLKGCALREKAGDYGMTYEPYPPYTVLKTKNISFEELNRLHGMEILLERYYNSGLLNHTVYYLAQVKKSAFLLFEELCGLISPGVKGETGQAGLIRALYEYASDFADMRIVTNLMRYDLCKSAKTFLPEYLRDSRSEALAKEIRKDGMRYNIPAVPGKDLSVQVFDFDVAAFLRSGTVELKPCALVFDYGSPPGIGIYSIKNGQN